MPQFQGHSGGKPQALWRAWQVEEKHANHYRDTLAKIEVK